MDILQIIQSLDLVPSLVSLVSQYPVVSTVFLVMGSARAIMKPLFALARVVVEQTESKKDDEILDQVEQSKVTKTIQFVLDYAFSIKPVSKK